MSFLSRNKKKIFLHYNQVVNNFFFLPVCVVKVVISFVVIENSTVGNVVVSFVVGEDSNDKDSLVDDADVDSCVDLSVIYYDKLKDVVNRFFPFFSHFFKI